MTSRLAWVTGHSAGTGSILATGHLSLGVDITGNSIMTTQSCVRLGSGYSDTSILGSKAEDRPWVAVSPLRCHLPPNLVTSGQEMGGRVKSHRQTSFPTNFM